MFTVALIGPDGVGKTTICRRLEKSLPLKCRYVYMGVNLEASNLVLPTTWLVLQAKRLLGKRPDMAGPPDPTRIKPRPKGLIKRTAASVKAALRITNQIAEEWFRQLIVWQYVWRGYVVLFDRHFFVDYYAYDIGDRTPGRPLSRRLHGYMLDRFYPRPNLLIQLDAPAELLFERKGEGTVELLDRRRQEYAELREVVEHFHTVDAVQSEADVEREVSDLICRFYKTKSGKTSDTDTSDTEKTSSLALKP